MSDSANAATRNLYTRNDGTRYTPEYRDGRGIRYDEALRHLSWPCVHDVPALGQKSGVKQLPEIRQVYGLTTGQMYMHPTLYTKLRHSDHMSFTKSQGHLGIGNLADPRADVYKRLYLGSKSYTKFGRQSSGRFEMAGDVAFKISDPINAIELYTKAIRQAKAGQPNIFAYEKRCAALAEAGRYREALADAELILANCETVAQEGAARMRVKALTDFLRRTDGFEAGYHQAVSTLICLLRPREHRQLVQSNPSNYTRPDTANNIGKGLSASASMGVLLNWDADGDGEIDMEEFRKGVTALGYKVKTAGKAAFKGVAHRGEV